jgi:hypothetical protein
MIMNDSLVVTQFIETMELLRVQGPKNSIKAVGDYLRADVPFEGKNDNFDPVSSFKERYGVQLNVEKVFMFTVRLQLEIMATDPPQKKSWDPFNHPQKSSATGVIRCVPGLFGRTVYRVPQSQFTRELSLRLAVLLIFL